MLCKSYEQYLDIQDKLEKDIKERIIEFNYELLKYRVY